MHKLFIVPFALLAFFFQQSPEGKEDSCNNYFNSAHRCACNKATECPRMGEKQEPTNKCSTFCKPEHCHCLHPCTS